MCRGESFSYYSPFATAVEIVIFSAVPQRFVLLDRTRYGGKRIVCVASDQAYRTNDQYQNNGQHHRIFGDVLALVMPPQVAKKMSHLRASDTKLNFTPSGCE